MQIDYLIPSKNQETAENYQQLTTYLHLLYLMDRAIWRLHSIRIVGLVQKQLISLHQPTDHIFVSTVTFMTNARLIKTS